MDRHCHVSKRSFSDKLMDERNDNFNYKKAKKYIKCLLNVFANFHLLWNLLILKENVSTYNKIEVKFPYAFQGWYI